MILRRLLSGVALVLTAFVSGPVCADEPTPGNYWGISYTGVDFDSVTGESVKVNGATIKLGREITQYFAIEAHRGIAKETQGNAFGNKFDMSHGAAYARVNLPYDHFNFYFIGGKARVKIDTGLQSATDDFTAGGIGMDFFGSERTALILEYVRYEGDDVDDTFDLITIGFKHHFEFVGFR